MMRDYLDKLSKLYYEGNPLVSDEEFDRLAELHNYEQVGASGGRSSHYYRMYSLQKVHYGEAEPSFSDPVKTPKLDGAAISALYVPNNLGGLQLAKILTRGDGIMGHNITDKLRHLFSSIIKGTEITQVNCEVVAPSFVPNARNYAAGALNLKDIEEIKTRHINVVAYEAVKEPAFDSYSSMLTYLAQNGFTTVASGGLNIYPTDGFVVRERNTKRYLDMGFTAKHPRGAYALKPKPEAAVTKLIDVIWQVGRTGVVSPVAILDPVVVGEATVSRATLHNIEYIEALELEIGCDVEVIRSGEIIPRIVRKL